MTVSARLNVLLMGAAPGDCPWLNFSFWRASTLTLCAVGSDDVRHVVAALLVEHRGLRRGGEAEAAEALVADLAFLDVDEHVGELVAVDDDVLGVGVRVGRGADRVGRHADGHLLGHGAGEADCSCDGALLRGVGLVRGQADGLGRVVARVGGVLLVVYAA
jgi:hypothetical protein